MNIIIGLGNPGEKFKNTKHNAGFLVLDEFAKQNNFDDFKLSKKFFAQVSESQTNNNKIILAKPETFMNESGKSAQKIIANYKLNSNDLLIIHDDIDLTLGTIKIAKNRGSAGHKGVESVVKEIGTQDFTRIRIGIKPENEVVKVKAKETVLKKFSAEQQKLFLQAIKKASTMLNYYLTWGLEKTMNEFNGSGSQE